MMSFEVVAIYIIEHPGSLFSCTTVSTVAFRSLILDDGFISLVTFVMVFFLDLRIPFKVVPDDFGDFVFLFGFVEDPALLLIAPLGIA